MKIHGQSIGSLLRLLPWQYKIVVGCGTLFIIYTAIYIPYVFLYLHLKQAVLASTPVVASGAVSPLGMLDPSLVTDGQTKKVWMAFTSQENLAYGATGATRELMAVRMAMAKPDKRCQSWDIWPAGGFDAKNDDIIAPDGQTVLRTGAWRIETPGLVYDPDDKGREWKLFAYKYFWANDQKDVMSVARHYGVIVYKYASDPTKDWSTEQWLFSPAPGYPPPPYQQTVLLHLNMLDPSLKDVTSYSRPSVIYKEGKLIMTLSAFTEGVTPDRVIMIASLDHGNSWRYLGTVLTQADAAAIDPTGHLEGATLVEQEGEVYLAAVLGTPLQRGVGTFIFSFDNFSKGLLQRDPATGVPALVRQVPLQGGNTGVFGGGSAAYNEGCDSGMLITAQDGQAERFKIYRTGFKPVKRDKQGEK